MLLHHKEVSNEFKSKLVAIETNTSNILDCANTSIILCRHTLHKQKSLLLKNGFDSLEDEIEFFKYIKQISATPLIYYSEVRSFELQFPMANMDTQRKYINKKISKLNRFFNLNIDFIQYIEQDHTHFDQQYFTRKFLDSFHIISSKFYFQDPDFTTARDMLLGKVKAYRRFIKYLQSRSTEKTQDYSTNQPKPLDSIPNLKWTSSKAALTELVYALYVNGALNNGNAEIKEIAIAMQKVFYFDMGDFYKIYAEIKFRKNSRTKFLDTLSTGLISFMDESEK